MTALPTSLPAAGAAPDKRWRWRGRLALAGSLLGFAWHSATGADLYDIRAATPARVLDAQYFGTHLHRLLPIGEPGLRATPWPAGQIDSLRLWDSSTRWADLEPVRGTFRFERLDAYVAQALAHGATPLMVLGSPPRWASARPFEPGPYGPGSAAEPASLDDWERYVSALARRYKGRIKTYELWNEPYFSDLPADRGHPSAFFTGSVEKMVELARRARAVLDREDPQALLLTPGFVGGVQRFEMFLQAGGGRYVGGVAYHFYAADDRGFIQLHHDVRAVMARHGLSGLPLYNTESGFAARNDEVNHSGSEARPDRATAAALLARSMLLGAFLGIDRFYQYAWDNGYSGMLRPASLAVTPSAAAFAAVRSWLLGTTLQGCRAEPGGAVACQGTRGDARVLIAWRAGGNGSSTLRLPAHARPIAAEHAVDRLATIDLQAVRDSGLVLGADPVALWWRP